MRNRLGPSRFTPAGSCGQLPSNPTAICRAGPASAAAARRAAAGCKTTSKSRFNTRMPGNPSALQGPDRLMTQTPIRLQMARSRRVRRLNALHAALPNTRRLPDWLATARRRRRIHFSFVSPTCWIHWRVHSADSKPKSNTVLPRKMIPSMRPARSHRNPTSHWCFIRSTGMPRLLR